MALKLKLKKKLNLKKSLRPSPATAGVAVSGPYRAAHMPGKPDNEWEVRDGAGVLVAGYVGATFDAARRRAVWLAEQLNIAFQRGAER